MSTAIQPKSSLVTFHLQSSGRGVAQTIRQEGSAHTIRVDAAPVFGGKDEYPSPIAYALSALISCSQVTAQLVAKDLGLKLNEFEFDIKADLDTAILLQGAVQGNANFQTVEINAIVDTDSTKAQLEQLRQETERRCPIYQLFLKSGVQVINNWSIRNS